MYHHRGRPPPKKAPSLRAPRNDRFRPRHAPIDQVVRLPPIFPGPYLTIPAWQGHDPVQLGLSLAAIGVTMRLRYAVNRTGDTALLVAVAAVTLVRIQAIHSQRVKLGDPEMLDHRNDTHSLTT